MKKLVLITLLSISSTAFAERTIKGTEGRDLYNSLSVRPTVIVVPAEADKPALEIRTKISAINEYGHFRIATCRSYNRVVFECKIEDTGELRSY